MDSHTNRNSFFNSHAGIGIALALSATLATGCSRHDAFIDQAVGEQMAIGRVFAKASREEQLSSIANGTVILRCVDPETAEKQTPEPQTTAELDSLYASGCKAYSSQYYFTDYKIPLESGYGAIRQRVTQPFVSTPESRQFAQASRAEQLTAINQREVAVECYDSGTSNLYSPAIPQNVEALEGLYENGCKVYRQTYWSTGFTNGFVRQAELETGYKPRM